MKRRSLLTAAAASVLATPWISAQVSDWPSRPVRIIVPSAPGSGGDSAARFFGDRLSKELDTSFVVENRAGAGGVIAAQTVKNAPADGYTIFLGSNTPLVITPLVMKNASFDPIADFKPVSGTTRGATMLSVATTSQIKSFKQLVTAGKEAKHPLSAGAFTSGYQLNLEWFARLVGIKLNVIPYRDPAQMYTDVAGGRLDFVISDVVGASAMIRSNKIAPLAVSSDTRHAQFPDVPTVAESGYPGFVTWVWSSLVVRTETPDPIVRRIAAAMQRIMASEQAKQYAKTNNTELLALGPDEMRKYQLEEFERFSKVAKAANVTPQ